MSLDLLEQVLSRAKLRTAELAVTRAAVKSSQSRDAVSQDYAERLVEKARFRALLNDEAQDGMRFRWYVKHVEPYSDLDALRRWIDAKIAKESSCLRGSENGSAQRERAERGFGSVSTAYTPEPMSEQSESSHEL